MNYLEAEVLDIRSEGPFRDIRLRSGGADFRVLTLEPPAGIVAGRPVGIVFKETEVILASGKAGESTIANRLAAQVTSVRKGELFSELVLESGAGLLRAVVLTDRLEELGIETGQSLLALIRAVDISLQILPEAA
jgi:molybdate transport system regulatory protein